MVGWRRACAEVCITAELPSAVQLRFLRRLVPLLEQEYAACLSHPDDADALGALLPTATISPCAWGGHLGRIASEWT